MKKLILVRHAKSSWKEVRLKDFDRPLNSRGKKEAPLLGKKLLSDGHASDIIYSSPAIRAKSTAELISKELNSCPISFHPNLYEASINFMLSFIQNIPDKYTHVILVGHNPTQSLLGEKLCGKFIGNLPTSGAIGIEFEVDSWQAVIPDLGSLIYHEYPKKN